MSNKLRTILADNEHQKYATQNGQLMHKKMQYITAETLNNPTDEISKKIALNKELNKFFVVDSKTEVPIAGYIKDRFVSRRIDRLVINEKDKSVYVLDYKTDTDKDTFRNKYVIQINEYKTLLRSIYPQYKIRGFILWLSDFTLEEIA